MKTPTIVLLAIGASLLLSGGGIGAAPFGVSFPTGWRSFDGPEFSLEPLNAFSGTSVRYQQVFQPVAFTGVGGGASAFWVEAMAFRLDATNGTSFSAGLDIQVNLSTTTRGPDGLSTLFSENIGTDDTAVYPRDSLPLSVTYLPGFSPQPESIRIGFVHPFYYDTNQGNLLLDIRTYRTGNVSFMDAVSVAGDYVSRVWANLVSAESGVADTLGLVTLFSVTPIPEPATWALLLSGTIFATVVLRRQANRIKG